VAPQTANLQKRITFAEVFENQENYSDVEEKECEANGQET
jgi:hypothetical protein